MSGFEEGDKVYFCWPIECGDTESGNCEMKVYGHVIKLPEDATLDVKTDVMEGNLIPIHLYTKNDKGEYVRSFQPSGSIEQCYNCPNGIITMIMLQTDILPIPPAYLTKAE